MIERTHEADGVLIEWHSDNGKHEAVGKFSYGDDYCEIRQSFDYDPLKQNASETFTGLVEEISLEARSRMRVLKEGAHRESKKARVVAENRIKDLQTMGALPLYGIEIYGADDRFRIIAKSQEDESVCEADGFGGVFGALQWVLTDLNSKASARRAGPKPDQAPSEVDSSASRPGEPSAQ